jgi:hypothetical protein
MNRKLVYCDQCGDPFEISSIEIKTKEVKGVNYLITYFVCPHCGRKFTICVEDKKLLNKKKSLRWLTNELHKMQADEDCDKLLIENQMRLIQRKLKECKEYSDKLKNKLADELD